MRKVIHMDVIPFSYNLPLHLQPQKSREKKSNFEALSNEYEGCGR